jgi:hypothetical protein
MNNFNQLINQLNNLNLQHGPPFYSQLFHEVFADDQTAILVCTRVYAIITNAFGQYGSVNVGIGGAAYTAIRDDLLAVRGNNFNLGNGANGQAINANNWNNLLQFLSEPVVNLPIYPGAGAGGQGQAKIALNVVISRIKERLNVILGALHLKNCVEAHQQGSWAQVQY